MPSESEILHPFVLWGQRGQQVFLSVQLQQVQKAPFIKITDERVDFLATGYGCQGTQLYSFQVCVALLFSLRAGAQCVGDWSVLFQLDFYLPVNPDGSRWYLTEKCIEIMLQKATKDTWPRATYRKEKSAWLKTDFDRFEYDTSDDDSSEDAAELKEASEWECSNRKATRFGISEKQKQLMSFLRSPLRMYLLLFNLFQTAGYGYVLFVLVWCLVSQDATLRANFYARVAPQLGMVQLAACLEVVHAALGWVRAGMLATLLQVFGRNLALFALIVPNRETHNSETVFWLFVAWSAIEVVRYPFYLLNQLGEELYLITYLRYTLWIPFYPLGFVCEGLVMLHTLPLIEKRKL